MFNDEFDCNVTTDGLQNKLARLGITGKRVTKTTKKVQHSKAKPQERWLCLCISDVHYGSQICDQAGKDIWSSDDCKRRVSEIYDKLLAVEDPNKYDAVYVLLLGDIVDGEMTYPGHAHNIDQSAYDQVAGVRDALWELLCRFKGHVQKVVVDCVMGNHGKISNFASIKSNFDMLVYQQLQLLSSVHPDKQISVTISHRDTGVFERLGYTILAIHRGPTQDVTPGQKTKLAEWHMEYGWDLHVTGHWHHPGTSLFHAKDTIRNGGLQPKTDYADRKALGNPPVLIGWIMEAGLGHAVKSSFYLRW